MQGSLLRDMSRKRKAKGVKLCALCGLPFAFFNNSAKFDSARCRQRWHRGHRSIYTVHRAAKHFFCGQLSDQPESNFVN
jgi:protein-arginine kinase activator protein McsA